MLVSCGDRSFAAEASLSAYVRQVPDGDGGYLAGETTWGGSLTVAPGDEHELERICGDLATLVIPPDRAGEFIVVRTQQSRRPAGRTVPIDGSGPIPFDYR